MNDYRDIIIAPVVTEKSAALGEKNVYVFKVKKDANKIAIKQAIEKIFKTKIEKITTVNTKAHSKRVGKYSGMTSPYKKAIVKLAAGSKIEL